MTPSALLDRHRHTALQGLDGATGDQSLCEASRDGTAPNVKRHEGAVAALVEVRRTVGAGPSGPDPDLRAAVLAARESWAGRAVAAGAGWAEYRAGGLEALDRLVAELDTLDTGEDDVEAPAAADDGGPASPDLFSSAPTGLVTLEPDVTVTLRELWPRRRVVAVLVLIAPTVWFLFQNIGGWSPDAPLWNGMVILVAAVTAAIVATYVPLPGRRGIDVGCRPCAAVAGVTALCAGSLLGSAPHDAGIAVVALGLVTFGLLQRQRGARSCPAPGK